MATWGKVGSWMMGLAAAALLLPRAAKAQLIETTIDPASANWTATAARTVGNNNSVLQAEAGWPGIGFTWLHGANETTDVGLHVGFNYGFEGTANTVTGFNLAVPYRHLLGQMGDTTIAFRTDPGLTIYGNHGSALVGVGGPIGVVMGFRLDARLTLDVGADVPILISFSNPAGFVFGPQVGGGGEYLIDQNLAVTARVRVGPEFALDSAGTATQTAFTTMIGLAYNMR
jgi:opacity protein-like surface antigen